MTVHMAVESTRGGGRRSTNLCGDPVDHPVGSLVRTTDEDAVTCDACLAILNANHMEGVWD